MLENISFNIIKLLFLISITLHNFEEVITMSKFMEKNNNRITDRLKKLYSNGRFNFAVIVITVFAYVITILTYLLSNNVILLLFLGYVGVMLLNAFFPHIIVSIIYRKYYPGLITAILLNIPINYIIIYKAKAIYGFSFQDILYAVVVMAIVLIITILSCFKFYNKK